MNPRVSVVMPAYNAQQFLREAVDSVLRQTYTDFELIIVDDCSRDTTWDMLVEYAAQDERITLVRNVTNLGEAGARNAGLQKARGEYIAAMDADDVLMPDRLQLQVKYLDMHPEVGLVAGNAVRMTTTAKPLSQWKLPTTHEELRAALLLNNPIPHPTVTMRHELVKQAGGYPCVFTTDYDMWWRLSRIARLASLPETLAHIRISTEPQRISHAQAPRQLLGSQAVSLQIAREIVGESAVDARAYERFFMSSRGKPGLQRGDIHRLQPLWDFVAGDPIYRRVIGGKLLGTAYKIARTQPREGLVLLGVVHRQFGVPLSRITKKALTTYLPEDAAAFRPLNLRRHRL